MDKLFVNLRNEQASSLPCTQLVYTCQLVNLFTLLDNYLFLVDNVYTLGQAVCGGAHKPTVERVDATVSYAGFSGGARNVDARGVKHLVEHDDAANLGESP